MILIVIVAPTYFLFDHICPHESESSFSGVGNRFETGVGPILGQEQIARTDADDLLMCGVRIAFLKDAIVLDN